MLDLAIIRRTLQPDFHMGWNLFLALVPLVLALVLFRSGRRPGLAFWLGLAIFLLFLPNAAYTLTDVIHLVSAIRRQPYVPLWAVVLVLIPQYALFMLMGWQAHVVSLMRLGDYLRARALSAWVAPVEMLLNVLVSLGIYFGRFQRLNSWDVIRAPEQLLGAGYADLTNGGRLIVMATTLTVVSLLYYATRFINRALWQYCCAACSAAANTARH